MEKYIHERLKIFVMVHGKSIIIGILIQRRLGEKNSLKAFKSPGLLIIIKLLSNIDTS